MGRTSRNIISFFKAIISGVIGSAIFFLLAIMALAIVKLIFLIAQRTMQVSRYSLGIVMAMFVIVGFVYGVASFLKRNNNYKLFMVRWPIILVDIILSLIAAFIIYLILKNSFGLDIRGLFIGLFIFMILAFYAFSALVVDIYESLSRKPRRRHVSKGKWIAAIVFNPVFVIIYILLFSMIIYDSIYVPCGVYIEAVDKSINTSSTQNLGIQQGEKVISIDGVPITSLQDVREYMNTLDATSQVVLETDRQVYYLNTYKIGERRVMGLIMQERICRRDIN